MPELQMLRIEVAGEWYAYEWSNFITEVDELYVDFAIIDEINVLGRQITSPPDPTISSRIESLKHILVDGPSTRRPFNSEQSPALRVAAIKYGSDGKFDLVGVGQALEAVEKIFKDLLDFTQTREEVQLINIDKKIEIYRGLGHGV